MRTTLRIDDSLLQELKGVAHDENIPFTQLINRVLRAGLRAQNNLVRSSPEYQEGVCELGKPFVNLDKALAISTQIEDKEILRKIEVRK